MKIDLTGFKAVKGLVWPKYDERCAQVTFDECERLFDVLYDRFPDGGRQCVQAGGNCGQLPRKLSLGFEKVYTFEPDHQNFVALCLNTTDRNNVVKFQAVLGNERKRIRLENGDDKFPETNCGAMYAVEGGHIPTMAIDDLALDYCDLICLDIEGGEYQALMGARSTLTRCKPLVVVEDKGLGHRFYGEDRNAVADFMQLEYYKEVARIGNDVVYSR